MATLHPRMFITQSTLEIWMDSETVDVQEQTVVLKKVGRSYRIEPAVRFLSVVPEGAAPELVGKVLSEKRIAELGGELMGDSVLFGEAAFEIESGYIGVLNSPEERSG